MFQVAKAKSRQTQKSIKKINQSRNHEKVILMKKNVPCLVLWFFGMPWWCEWPHKISKSGHWGILRKLHFSIFSPIFTQPHQIWLFSRVFGPFLLSEMIINIIGDEYGSILICAFFGFLHFLTFWGIFGIFWFSVGVGEALGVLLSYKIQ